MSTRKRPRPSAQLEEAQPPSRDNDHQAGVASHMDAEGAQPSPRPSRSVKQPALHGSSEAQTQQLFQALHVLEQLALPQLVRLADEHSIVWCRLKGFPAWPVSSTAPLSPAGYHLCLVCFFPGAKYSCQAVNPMSNSFSCCRGQACQTILIHTQLNQMHP